MFDRFVPDKYFKSIYDINYKALKKSGIKCLVFGLGNTLVPESVKSPTRKVKDLFEDYDIAVWCSDYSTESDLFCLNEATDVREKISKSYIEVGQKGQFMIINQKSNNPYLSLINRTEVNDIVKIF